MVSSKKCDCDINTGVLKNMELRAHILCYIQNILLLYYTVL